MGERSVGYFGERDWSEVSVDAAAVPPWEGEGVAEAEEPGAAVVVIAPIVAQIMGPVRLFGVNPAPQRRGLCRKQQGNYHRWGTKMCFEDNVFLQRGRERRA